MTIRGKPSVESKKKKRIINHCQSDGGEGRRDRREADWRRFEPYRGYASVFPFMALQHTRPLPDTHPEFSILQLPGLCEYRVENWSLRRDGSGRVNRSSFHWCWQELLAAPAVSFWWLKVRLHTNFLRLLTGSYRAGIAAYANLLSPYGSFSLSGSNAVRSSLVRVFVSRSQTALTIFCRIGYLVSSPWNPVGNTPWNPLDESLQNSALHTYLSIGRYGHQRRSERMERSLFFGLDTVGKDRW